MKVLFRNIGYFTREIKTIIKLDLISNIFSIISLAFIFFLLSLILSGGWITNNMIAAIEKQAEISVYYMDGADDLAIADEIKDIEGVLEVAAIDEVEAKNRMTEIMGEESRIIELFDHNPFSPYIEVKINLDNLDTVADEVKSIEGIEVVRDNRDILEKLKGISNLVNILGLLVIFAVSVATLVITSHIIRQGIYVNREQINTLRLLGAPESFITLPFILEGLLMTFLAGIFSVGMVYLVIKYIYSKITSFMPFLVVPDVGEMILGIGVTSIILSLVLGLMGSFFGIKSTKE